MLKPSQKIAVRKACKQPILGFFSDPQEPAKKWRVTQYFTTLALGNLKESGEESSVKSGGLEPIAYLNGLPWIPCFFSTPSLEELQNPTSKFDENYNIFNHFLFPILHVAELLSGKIDSIVYERSGPLLRCKLGGEVIGFMGMNNQK